MTAHATDGAEHFAGSTRLFLSVWVWLLALTGFEVFLGEVHQRDGVLIGETADAE